MAKLQDERTVRKICALDDNVCMAFAGLTADARIVINRARVLAANRQVTVEDPVTVEYITRYIASLKFVDVTVADKVSAEEFVPRQEGMPRVYSARITAVKPG